MLKLCSKHDVLLLQVLLLSRLVLGKHSQSNAWMHRPQQSLHSLLRMEVPRWRKCDVSWRQEHVSLRDVHVWRNRSRVLSNSRLQHWKLRPRPRQALQWVLVHGSSSYTRNSFIKAAFYTFHSYSDTTLELPSSTLDPALEETLSSAHPMTSSKHVTLISAATTMFLTVLLNSRSLICYALA